MFENIIWAKALADAEPLSWDMAKQVIQSQYNLATLALTAVIFIAAIAVGYNIIVSERTVRKLKKDFKADIDLMKKAFNDQIRETRLFATGAQDALYAAIAEASNRFETAALHHARAARGLIEIKKIANVTYHDQNLKTSIMGCKSNLENCRQCDIVLDIKTIEEIKEFVPLIPDLLSDEGVKIEQILNELEKMAQKKRR